MPLFPRSGGFIDMKVLGKGESIRHLMTDLLGDRLAVFFFPKHGKGRHFFFFAEGMSSSCFHFFYVLDFVVIV